MSSMKTGNSIPGLQNSKEGRTLDATLPGHGSGGGRTPDQPAPPGSRADAGMKPAGSPRSVADGLNEKWGWA